jgi:hypothetical protein
MLADFCVVFISRLLVVGDFLRYIRLNASVQLHAVTRILKYGSVKFSAIINE